MKLNAYSFDGKLLGTIEPDGTSKNPALEGIVKTRLRRFDTVAEALQSLDGYSNAYLTIKGSDKNDTKTTARV